MKHRRFLEWQQKRWLIFSNRVTRTYRKIAYGKTLNPPCIPHIFLLTPYEKYPNYSNYLSLFIILLPFYPYIYICLYQTILSFYLYIYFLKKNVQQLKTVEAYFSFPPLPVFFSFLFFISLLFLINKFPRSGHLFGTRRGVNMAAKWG